MAEFNLGRIRFVWKDTWNAGTVYYKDDVVRYGGKTYICMVNHTSNASFDVDLTFTPSKWNVMSNGQDWRSGWTTGTVYKIGDIVKYGGNLYIANLGHTSAATSTLGLEADLNKWDLFGEGFDWKNEWTTSTRYKINDVVKYGGYTYVANVGHTSAATVSLGLEADQSKWDEFNQGLEYKTAWLTSVRYKVNDVVKYGGGLYICVSDHTSTTFESDESNWETFTNGLQYQDEWSNLTLYQIGDIVRYGGNQYVALTNHTGLVPTTATSDWRLFAEGLNWSSDWVITQDYRIGDVVRVNGYTYLAIADSPSTQVTVSATNAGTRIFTANTTEGLVSGMAVKFTGTTFGNVFTNATYYIDTVEEVDEFTINDDQDGSEFTPTTASGLMTATVAAHPTNTSYFARLNSGISWQGTWQDDREYEVGDAVQFGTNSYLCIKKHRSEADDGSSIINTGGGAALSRPDQDISGTYWNVIAVGTETEVLTRGGDLVYYSEGVGPARLPIGTEGQILRVSDAGFPEWATLGQSDFTYYVNSATGTDLPAPTHGVTLDKPFKTIRYAAEQVLNGARYPNARQLIEINRAFIQREVTAWIRYQIDNATISSIWYNFTYETAKCERDVGFIIDRTVYDLTHGGNLKIRAAAQTFLNALDDGPFSTAEENNGTGPYNNLAAEGQQSAAAYNYMLEVIEAVLNQTPPATLYQNVGDDSTAIAPQNFVSTIVSAEPGALPIVQELVGVITTVLVSGDTADIPERVVPNNLIRAATGRYRETLPIIVPAGTCIQGDELRSTNAGPAGSLVNLEDSYYSIRTLDRLSTVIGQLVVGTNVTPTSGNTIPQVDQYPYGDTAEATVLTDLVQMMRNQIDFSLNTMYTATLTDPVGYNSSYLVGYGDARKLIQYNKKWLQEEVISYLAANYPTLAYGKTDTRRDTGYLIDAIIYDLTYGGNAMSVKAGLAYWDGDDNSGPQIPTSIRVATLASINFLKERMQSLSTNDTITPLQTAISRYTGTAGSVAARTFIGANMDVIIELVTDGPENAVYTLTDPSATNGVTSTTALISAYSTLNSAVETIKDNTIDYINTNFGSFTYNSSLCRRDAGFLVDAGYYDVAFGSNFWAVQNGISYYRQQSAVVITGQLQQELGSVNFIKSEINTLLTSYSTARTRSHNTYNEILDILENGVGNADALVFTNTGTANFTNARQQLQTNRAFIITEISDWLNTNYNSVWVGLGPEGQAKCQRDIGYSIDALSYDVNYGGNLATRNIARSLFNNITGVSVYPVGQQAASAAMYTQIGVVCADIVQELYPGQNTSGTAATATEGGRMTTLAGNIENVITANSLSGLVAESAPSITWAAADIQAAAGIIASNKTDIVKGTLQFITNTYSSLVYDHAKCSRDVGIILKAVGYDFMFNSNYQSIKAAHSYLRLTATEVYTLNQKAATRAALEYVRTQAIANVSSNATAITRINVLMPLINNIIFSASNEGSVCQTEERNRYYAELLLELNREFLVAEATAYIDVTFSDTATASDTVDDSFTISSTSWLTRNAGIKFTGTVFGGVTAGRIYYVRDIISSTKFSVSESRFGAIFNLNSSSGSMSVSLAYDSALCLRDVNTYIDALKYDLRYPGNYRSRYAARYYINAVTGSLEEDMFYLRDATGLRDMTLDGLFGDLTPPNAYGTSRVTAGAYASLDPGWGPADFTTWIISRSPYVQGLTTFGNAAIGQKIDGALHNGGNDSITSNDFTQVISDGIGAWVTNNGRAELVSVFTYYSHIGYLSENGGRIRGTNGNNSYGSFGAIAEGVDLTETPNTAIVDNITRFSPELFQILTDGSSLLRAEYLNAGIDHTTATWTITGGGSNGAAVQDEFRDDGVYQVRLIEGEAESEQFGGLGYVTFSSTAQVGDSTSITLAATDGSPDDQYVGMTVLLTGGTGAGQIGRITAYSSGTKIATVEKFSTGAAGWDHVVPGTAIVSPDASTTYTIEPTVEFSSPGFTTTVSTSIASSQWTDAVFGQTTGTYINVTGTYSGDGNVTPATFNVIRNGWKYIVTGVTGGSGYERLQTITIAGTDLGGASPANDIVITITSVDPITGELLLQDEELNPAVPFDFVGTGFSGRYVAIRTAASGAYSNDGITWTSMSMPSNQSWTSVAAAQVDDVSSIQNTGIFVAVASGTNQAAYSEDGINWDATTMPESADWISVTYGNGRWVAIALDTTTVAVSLDGITWDITGTLATTGYNAITYGKGLFVAVRSGTTVAASSTDGETWATRVLPAASTWTTVTYGNNKFVALASNSNDGAYSLNGTTWSSMTTTSPDGSSVAGYEKVSYGQGLFMATVYNSAVEDYSFVVTSEDGIVWTARGLPGPSAAVVAGYNALAFGTPDRNGYWAVLSEQVSSHTVRVRTGATAKGRASVADEKVFQIIITEPGSGYDTVPTMTVTDPSVIYDVPHTVRVGSGVLANPTFTNRGSSYVTGSANLSGLDGFADNYQATGVIAIRRLTQRPVAGSNIVFSHLPDRVFKLVNVLTFLGEIDGSYKAFFQISPTFSIDEAPENGVSLETRIRYSQVRLTGHDFLDIGTGGFTSSNYPGTPLIAPDPADEVVENGGGRVFFTSTDQDGNFRVGNLFAVEQSTGIATLNADAFNISGLNELNLGNVTLGGGSATITEFSTDPFFSADSDNVVPTQRAIKAYIASQIGGGGAALNVNSVTAGSILINSNQITTITSGAIQMNATFDFRGGIIGVPIALNYFLI